MPKLIRDEDLRTATSLAPTTTSSTRFIPIQEVTGGERLALNIYDLDRIPDEVRPGLVSRHLAKKAIHIPTELGDEIGIELVCPLLDAACICDMLRSRDRASNSIPTRIYLFRERWVRVQAGAYLSVLVGDKVVLNPKVFDVERVIAEPIPL